MGCLSFLLLDLLHELFNVLLERFLEELLPLSVFLELLGCGSDSNLESLTAIFTVFESLLILFYIILQVVVDRQFLIKCNESVYFMLKFNLSLFMGQLQLLIISVVKMRLYEGFLLGRTCLRSGFFI